ncbi:DUF5694 domain-containing protein [Rubricoccus marinus]|uniref:Haem-binding uptake Tiki superfamily ChaN domain-containing protein n=1 Tax=Rubricoccus marinus TaxID=716817 RepID=A0A259TXM9_9BACT|nr:DUF5694 domain-containing protein [Rubricoccus marinus]OZC02328.1 hypothetical protein BSZ36_04655 [Rubricoccus marinus]
MRTLLRLLALAFLALAVRGFAANAQTAPGAPEANPFAEATPNPGVWPACAAGQIEVMLLGTVHMANNNLDAQNTDVPDVRTPEIQAELDALVARLAPYAPSKVMIEWNWGAEQARADSAYAAYLASGGQTESREETDQVAFRLARSLGHDAVYPIDFARGNNWGEIRNYAASGGTITHTMNYADLVPERLKVDEDQIVRELTMIEYHAFLNDDAVLRNNHFGMFAGALGAGSDEAYPGPDLIAGWYGRNLNMVHHILRTVEPGDERVFVLVGAGHVRAMRHFLDEAPHFCPVSPLPYLQDDVASAQ